MFGGKGKTNKSIIRLETLMQSVPGKQKKKRTEERKKETKQKH